MFSEHRLNLPTIRHLRDHLMYDEKFCFNLMVLVNHTATTTTRAYMYVHADTEINTKSIFI